MHDQKTKLILEAVRQGRMSVDDALLQLKLEPFQDLGYAKVDHHRRVRQGVPEVIYGAGKTPEQIIGIVSAMKQAGQDTILITRLSPEAGCGGGAGAPPGLSQRRTHRHHRLPAGAGRPGHRRHRHRGHQRCACGRGGGRHGPSAGQPGAEAL